MIWSGRLVCRRLGNASLLNAMVDEIDDMNLNGIEIRRAMARARTR
jgi:hypothetical protein